MARKTFISYKYSEARGLRDRIIKAMGSDATYYTGETSDSPALTDFKTETIKEHLKDMIYYTSVTIVILSPNMLDSNWIDWEIEYSLKSIKRGDRYSHNNGIVAVIQKVNGSYDWLINYSTNCHGTPVVSYKTEKLFPIIFNNYFNSNPPQWHCNECRTYNGMNGSYIAMIKEDDFLTSINSYVENAYNKSQNNASGYDLQRTI